MLVVGVTGLLLGWKKNVDLLPPTQRGTAVESMNWVSLDSVLRLADTYTRDSLQLAATIDRIDVRPGKGVAKIIYEDSYRELQIDLATGTVLSVGQRHSDWIEQLHDGSLFDRWLGLDEQPLKLTWSSLLSLGLILLSVSGFFLWYNPRRIRRFKAR